MTEREESRLVVEPADFSSSDLHDLLRTHLAFCSDPESNVPGQPQYALDLDELQQPNLRLFCCYEETALPVTGTGEAQDRCEGEGQGQAKRDLLGCAAIKTFKPSDYHWPPSPPADRHAELEAELKSMHTRERSRGRGVGRLLIARVERAARDFGVATLRLETGTTEAFAGTRLFFGRCGFEECGPYADYVVQENSLFMAKRI